MNQDAWAHLLNLLSTSYAWQALAILLGLCVGSFINVLAHRLPIMMDRQWQADLAQALQEQNADNPTEGDSNPDLNSTQYNLCLPRSHCPACNNTLHWWQNIPCLSYLILRGRCGFCATPISWQYPAVEALTALWFFILALLHPPGLLGLCLMMLSAALIGLSIIDFKTYLLPDDITLPLLWAGLLLNTWEAHVALEHAVLGAALGYMVLWGIYWAFKWCTGKEGMGYGDFKLLAALGAWFGVQSIMTILLFASISGVFFGLAVQAMRKQSTTAPFPFGPCLVAGAFAWMLGLDVSHWL